MKTRLHQFLVFGIPLLILAGQFLIEAVVPVSEKPAFHSEGGPHELLQVLFLVIAIPVALYLFFKIKNPWLKIWTLIAALCCVYVAGEELSWGQQVFHWGTPEQWSAINDQNETNLHNTSAWLDQKPRLLLEIGVLVGGLIIPALRRWAPNKLPQKFKDIYPDNAVVVTASMAVVTKLIDLAGDKIFWRASEVIELYLYYFVLLYVLGLKNRWRTENKI